jgi:hypothetical protein
MDDASGLSFDGHHSIDVREHRPSHRERTRCQYQGCVPADRASVRFVSTARGQHSEYCCRCRCHGGGCRVGLWHQPASHDRFFCVSDYPLQLFIPYHRYVFILKWLTVSLLAYAAVLFTVHVPWEQVATQTVWPKITLDSSTAAMVVGVFGTTISPYLFFWQASEEVEDMEVHPSSKCSATARR